MPAASAGSSPSRPAIIFWSSIPRSLGILGPVMSASSMPTLKPLFCRAAAKFTVTVLLPTPPFPLPITILCFIRVIRSSVSFCKALGSSQLPLSAHELQRPSQLSLPASFDGGAVMSTPLYLKFANSSFSTEKRAYEIIYLIFAKIRIGLIRFL